MVGPHPSPPLFLLGQITGTPGVLGALAPLEILEALSRHVRGDWGDLCEEDRQANDSALRDGARLLSAYRTRENGRKFWVITEADRSSTTLLWPEEY